MTEILWNGRIFDPATGEAIDGRAITIEGDTIVTIDDAVGDPPDGFTIWRAQRSCPG